MFLGRAVYEYPRTKNGRWAHEQPAFQPQSGLGILRDPQRQVLRRDNEPAVLASTLKRVMDAAEPLVVAKSNSVSRVHRRVYMDYVGVKRYGPGGKPVGEVRLVGLFTADAYNEPAPKVPLIRQKVANVLARAGKAPSSHDQRRLHNVLESYPRDELFQISEDELLQIAQGVVHLYDRPRLRVFVRRDPFDRFVSILLYVPRGRFDAGLALKAGEILARAWGGRLSAYYPAFSDLPLARTHYIIGLDPGEHLEPQADDVEADIAACMRTWRDRFEEVLRDTGDRVLAADVHARYAEAFPPGYQDLFGAREALADLETIETLGLDRPVAVRAYRAADDPEDGFRFKLYRRETAAPLSDMLPIVESMGLRALVEHGFELKPAGEPSVWVHELILRRGAQERLDIEHVKGPFEAAFVAVWSGLAEDDGFNRLVFELGIGWRDAALIRALARYRQQSGLDPSQAVQEDALADNPAIARLILDLFRTKFDPALAVDIHARGEQAQAIFGEIEQALQAVVSLDADRALRRLALLVRATLRTNYFQLGEDGHPKPYISFKVDSRALADLPAPRPYREIYVWSPQVEGVHLRFGPVARGGLRWSDRRDDFRTEVLGLVKAQQVKNAVIVPVGAKGGFYPKRLPKGPPEAVRAEGVEAYRTYLRGLLDVTDSLDPQGQVIPPPGVVRFDGDDPYLVVAADKGTATFSDIANAMAESYRFWLGDAFASGGSQGYDHKAMGITARGAWEAVKRHFREMGKDIQKQPFSCIGVGDMSGDVFGNGMLLSKKTKLIAAFDHRDVFIDPEPDPAKSWVERKRMFALPRSSWQDYDKALISKGGGVWSRQAKAIPLSKEAQAILGVEESDLTPADLIKAILKAPAELLYLGGIGTYVKAPGQSHAEVGDKATDAVRVDATELRVKVVGEGANLGVTQAGRVAFARAGGRIDTDAIDNSAGVDTSDHEVNIKILTSALEAKGELTRPDRDNPPPVHDRRGRRPCPAAQPRPDPGPEPAGADGGGGTGQPRRVHGRPGRGRAAGPGGGRAAGPDPDRRAAQGRQGPDPARTGGIAGLRQAGALGRDRGFPGAGRRLLRDDAGGLFPQAPAALPRGHARPPAAPRDHRHQPGQRHRRHRRPDLPRAPEGRRRLRHARAGDGLRGGLAGVPPGRRLGFGHGAGRFVLSRAGATGPLPGGGPGAAAADLLAGAAGRRRGGQRPDPGRSLPPGGRRTAGPGAGPAVAAGAPDHAGAGARLHRPRRAPGPGRAHRDPASPDLDLGRGRPRPLGRLVVPGGGAHLPCGGRGVRLRPAAGRGRRAEGGRRL